MVVTWKQNVRELNPRIQRPNHYTTRTAKVVRETCMMATRNGPEVEVGVDDGKYKYGGEQRSDGQEVYGHRRQSADIDGRRRVGRRRHCVVVICGRRMDGRCRRVVATVAATVVRRR